MRFILVLDSILTFDAVARKLLGNFIGSARHVHMGWRPDGDDLTDLEFVRHRLLAIEVD